MPTVKDIRNSIDQMLDRWEAAASTLEQSANATAATIAEEIDAQKRKASEAVEAVKASVAALADVPEEVRHQATAAADQVRQQLEQAKQDTLAGAEAQRDAILAAFQHLHQQLEQVGDKADTNLEKAALSLLLAERELELKTELALVRYAAHHTDDAVALDKSRQQMSEQFTALRQALDEQRKAAVSKSKELADALAPTFEKAKSAFIKAYEEFTR